MEGDLIPGLLDCLALECLLRLPFQAILAARAVCRRWKNEIDSPSFYRIRMDTGLGHRIVTFLLRGKLSSTVGKLHLALYEPATGVCMIRQLAVNCPINKKGCSKAMIVGRELVVIGGWDTLENRHTGDVHIYDLLSGTWRLGVPKPAPEQSIRRCGLIGEKVFVISRRKAEGKKLWSAFAYYVAADSWIEMPDLRHDMCQGTSIDGSFCEKFWQSREEYNYAIENLRKYLPLSNGQRLRTHRFRTTKEEIIICVLEEKSGEMVAEVTLSEDALRTLLRRLGLRPNKFRKYLQSFCFQWL